MNTIYNPKNVILTFFFQQIHGFAEGTFITVDRSVDSFTKTIGADGESTKVKSNDISGLISFTLMAGSQSNKMLSDFLISDETLGNLVAPCQLVEKNTGNVILSPLAYVKRWPNVTYQTGSANSMTWQIECLELYMRLAGGEELRPLTGNP